MATLLRRVRRLRRTARSDGAEPSALPRTRMTLRRRLMLGTALAVTVGIAVVTGFAYLATKHNLLADVDRQLHRIATSQQQSVHHQLRGGVPPDRLRPLGSEIDGYLQYASIFGPPMTEPGDLQALKVTDQTRQVALGNIPGFTQNATVNGGPVRMLTTQLTPGVALQVALPVSQEYTELTDLGVVLGIASLVGIALAMGLGWVVARTSLSPVARLTATAERIATTQDLAYRMRMEETRSDELGRLATSFNAMLDAVQRATSAQRQLVADASHELRTPLTSLRTNAEVLALTEDLPPAERSRILETIVAGLAEMSGLVSDIVELARGEERTDLREDVDLRALVAECVGRARMHWPNTAFTEDLAAVDVVGAPERLRRAVSNILDNAAKFSPPHSTVEVRLTSDAVLTIRDHGPGIPEESLEHVFDRFYRARAARGAPGSGLGLAIVRQVADLHGGAVTASRADGGGTVIRFALRPAVRPPHTDTRDADGRGGERGAATDAPSDGSALGPFRAIRPARSPSTSAAPTTGDR